MMTFIATPRVSKPLVVARSPIPRANLALWLRADRGVVLDTTSTPTVARWEDQSGKGRHATQSTKTKQPVVVLGVNNNNAIRFTASALQSLAGAFGSFLNTSRTIYIVASLAQVTYGMTLLDLSNSSNVTNSGSLIIKEGSSLKFRRTNAADTSTPFTYDTAWNIYTFSASLTSASGFVNGGLVVTSSLVASYADSRFFRIGSLVSEAANYYLDGSVAEVLVYEGIHSGTARSKVWDYLSKKYAIIL